MRILMSLPPVETVIERLNLQKHLEGGYYRRTYQADQHLTINTDRGERLSMTSIFYLLTHDEPIGHWHLNQSDIVHYFHFGVPLEYYLINPDGHLTMVTMGADIEKGQQLQLIVPGGVWKASKISSVKLGDYGLISEAVSPGFDLKDRVLGNTSVLLDQFPQHKPLIEEFSV